ncbi:MAG: Ig-like domain-containing protein [Bacteroidales bacterium]|jgi:hypothetical protein|nr:Ig-like domain-containing protein [Bacteroidales bacterium]
MKKLFFMLIAACILAGCSDKDDDKDDSKDIVVSDENQLTQTVYADQTSGNNSVTFTTTGTWTSSVTQTGSGTPDWISITPDYGDVGNHTISIILDPNDTGTKRTATITITCNGQTVKITVSQSGKTQTGEIPKRVTDVSLNKNEMTLTKGESETLVVTILPADATNNNIEWRSNNTNVATVDATGKVTAVTKGTARIYAASADDSTIEDYCVVTVLNPIQGTLTINGATVYNFETIKVSCGKAPLGGGHFVQHHAIVTMADLSQATFAFSVYFADKKLSPVAGTFLVGSGTDLVNGRIFDSTVSAPGWFDKLSMGLDVTVATGDGTITITYNGATRDGRTISFAYSGTYELFIDPAIQ